MGEDFLPLTVGGEWKYDMFDAVNDVPLAEKNHELVEKVDNDVKFENTGGGESPNRRWMRRDGSRNVWLRKLFYVGSDFNQPDSDQYYDPPALRFDCSRMTSGEEWGERLYIHSTIEIGKCPDWSEDRAMENLTLCPPEAISTEEVQETWSVVAVDESLLDVLRMLEPGSADGVPAGDFEVTCHQRTCAASACNSGTYCFARGVGKVFELSKEREALTEFRLP